LEADAYHQKFKDIFEKNPIDSRVEQARILDDKFRNNYEKLKKDLEQKINTLNDMRILDLQFQLDAFLNSQVKYHQDLASVVIKESQEVAETSF